MSAVKATLLLVDDEEENLLVLSTLLDMEYRVLTAQSVSQALVILEDEDIDVLVTDQRMPEASGVELLRQARLLYPDVVRMALTAYTDVDLILEAINEGAVYRYIIKPWSVDEMRTSIRQAVEWGRLRREHGVMAAELKAANAELLERNSELLRRNTELTKMREELINKEKLAAVGRFATEMVHEMSNTVLVTKMLFENLTQSLEDEQVKKEIELCGERIRHLETICSDVRGFTSGNSPELQLSLVSPERLVERVVALGRWHPQIRHVELVLRVEPIRYWRLDRSKMMHLVSNLVRNAAYVSPPGAPVVIKVTERKATLLIEVEDRGPGIPPERREWIFEPFNTTRIGEEGTGLGLTICRWVAQMHGGTITVSNSEQGGARFVVRIPWIISDAGVES